MGFSVQAEYLIKSLRENKRCGAKRLCNMYANKEWDLGALKVLTDTKGTADRRPDSGQPRVVCTTAIIHEVEEPSLSQ